MSCWRRRMGLEEENGGGGGKEEEVGTWLPVIPKTTMILSDMFILL
jgi:hypothetical protein